MSEATPAKLTPVKASERVLFVDVLRGFALFGVLAANMAGYAGLNSQLGAWPDPLDRLVQILIRFFVEAKFYSLLSLLLGWGVAVQMLRAEERGGRFVPFFLRRMAILFVMGIADAILIWQGDVLALYAALGILLLLFRRWSPKALLATAAALLLFALVVPLPVGPLEALRSAWEGATGFLRAGIRPESLFATGSFGDISRLRLEQYAAGLTNLLYYFGSVFSMFLLGLYVGKRRLFHEIDRHLPLVHRVMWAGLVIGVLFNGAFVYLLLKPSAVPVAYSWTFTRGSRTIGAPALMLFYVSAIILLWRKKSWRERLAPLGALGRATLSNYLLQSIVATTIFYGYGLGLYGQIDPLLGLLITLAIYVGQIRLSAWWFQSFRFGPAEWLWRSLGYGKRQRMRLGEVTGERVPGPAAGRARRIVEQLSSPKVLLTAWVFLIMWAAALGIWHFSLERPGDEAIAEGPGSSAAPAATPARAQPGSASEAESHVVATPAVDPVPFNPGPAAADGDLQALAAAFDASAALAQIEALTGPPFYGRQTGSPEAWAAADYISEQFEQFGLQPAGDDGTFFQSFPVYFTALAEVPRLVVTGPDGVIHDDYQLNQDYSTILRWYSGAGSASGTVVWADDCSPDDLAGVEVTDRVLLCHADANPLMDTERYALEHGAVGLLLLTDPLVRPADFGNTHRETWVPEPIPTFRVYPSVVEDLLQGSGRSLADLSITYTPLVLETRIDLSVATIGAESCPQESCRGRNVLGVLPGRDPAYADQVLVVGAHFDHLGQTPDGTVWGGANDNASGVAVMLEIARTWHEQGYVPRHTVLFAAWDAEEVGLNGSTYYVQHPSYPLDRTLANINLDMVGAGGDTLYIDGQGRLTEQVRQIAIAMGVEAQVAAIGRSDHAPFLAAGIPAAMLIWYGVDDPVPDYHRPGDTVQVIQLDKLERTGQIAALALLGITEGEPAIDELLAERAAAVTEGDLGAFLATSLPTHEAAERSWFADVQAWGKNLLELQATDVRVLGRRAVATVQMSFSSPAGDEVLSSTIAVVDVESGAHAERLALGRRPPGTPGKREPGRIPLCRGLSPGARGRPGRVGRSGGRDRPASLGATWFARHSGRGH